MEKTISYVRPYPDENGISHFEEVAFKLTAEDVQSSAGYFDDWHNAPRRQFIFCLEGEFDLYASDGQKRRFAQGSILLVEDTTGKGHKGRVIGSEDVLMLVVTLE